MNKLPKIIVIDDAYGCARPHARRNVDRENVCVRTGLQDVTGDVQTEDIPNPVAEAVFCRGQIEVNDYVENDLQGTLQTIRRGWEGCPRWSLLLLDLHFKTGPVGPEGEPEGRDSDRNPQRYFGLRILEKLWANESLQDIPIIILSAMGRDTVEERFAEHGAWDFVDKTNLDRQKLKELIHSYGLITDETVVGHSLPMLKCLREARRRSSRGNDNILVLGETGTGKELLAEYIYRQSDRGGPYVPLFTQGVPESVIEDRIFGHEKGAFTGADQAKPGAAEQADGGTLYMDEFGTVPGRIQAKLLRLLDKNIRETQRIGGDEPKKVDLQVILASNRLDILSAEDFRRDILFRVKASDPIVLPPLRERREDIPLLAEHFVRKYEQELDAARRHISDDALERLEAYEWPGNVRELEDVIERAVDRYRGLKHLSPAHLQLGAPAAVAKVQGQGKASGFESSESSDTAGVPPHLADGMEALLEVLRGTGFDPHQPENWAGNLPDLQGAFAELIARYLRAALETTKKTTAENPQGEIQITPAVKLVTGNSSLSTTKAADLIKRCRKISRDPAELWDTDPLLKEAYETALRLRPKG